MGQTTVQFECPNAGILSPAVIDALRTQYNNVIEIYGYPLNLYIPVNDAAQVMDLYGDTPKLRYKGPYVSKGYIVWSPTTKQLKNFGIFTEEDVPLLVWLKNSEDLPTLTSDSFIGLNMGYANGKSSVEYFDLLTQVIKSAYNAVVITAWLAAPRRKAFNITEIEAV